MSKRATPRTDAFFATFADGEAAPSHAEYYDWLCQLERELAEAREENLEQARLLGMSGEREADLRVSPETWTGKIWVKGDETAIYRESHDADEWRNEGYRLITAKEVGDE